MDERSLTSSASTFAARALADWERREREPAMLQAGVSLELLCKAALYRRSPALVAASKIDSLLRLTGHAHRAREPLHTITGGEALLRTTRFLPRLEAYGTSLRLLLDLRNGVAHAGEIPKGALEHVLTDWLLATQLLLDDVGNDAIKAFFFGGHRHLVDTLTQQRNEQFAARMQGLREAARKRWQHVTQSLDDPQLQECVAAGNARNPAEDDEHVPTNCPVCQQVGCLSGASDTRWEADVDVSDGEPTVSGQYGIVFLAPRRFDCPHCALTLGTSEELAFFELGEPVDVRDLTDEEYADIYADDYYDAYRDRF